MEIDRSNPEIKRFDALDAEFKKVFLTADKGFLKLTVASVVANQMPLDPVWVLLVAPPSGGKTEVISMLNDLKFVFPISDLTVNTFASGQVKIGKETSLLHKMPPGAIMTFKDFTSMLSKNQDARTEIMGQLREIYDGEYTKRTGTGDDIKWRGKVGALAGSTEAVYEYNEEMSVMGDRFIMYCIVQPDRLEVARKSLKNKNLDMEEERQYLRKCATNFINHVIENMNPEHLELSPETEEDLLSVANFCTMVRSGVMIDQRKGFVKFVPQKEMPMRMTGQLHAIASGFLAMKSVSIDHNEKEEANEGKISNEELQILYKVAFDSIPIKRRMALKKLAAYTSVTTAGLATAIDYHTQVVAGWLSQLNSLGIIKRQRKTGPQGDLWVLRPEFRAIMNKFEGIQTTDATLESEEIEEEVQEFYKGRDSEEEIAANQQFDMFVNDFNEDSA